MGGGGAYGHMKIESPDEVVRNSKVFNMSKKSDIMGNRGGEPLN